MKKIALTSLLAVLFATGAQANQWFVGGSVGYQYDQDTSSTYIIAPELGYNLTNKWDIGLGLGIGGVSFDSSVATDDIFTFSVAPFARYNVVSFGDFRVLLKGVASYSYVSQGDLNASVFGVNVKPMVIYDISPSFSLYAELNFLNAGINVSSDNTPGSKSHTSAGFGVDSSNVLNTNNFQVGFTYNF